MHAASPLLRGPDSGRPRAPAVARAIGARVVVGAKQKQTPIGARVPPSRPIGASSAAPPAEEPEAPSGSARGRSPAWTAW